MASDVSICNLALAHLGDEATVTSIDPPEGSQQAEHCARYYPIARNTVLESHAWKFATRRMALVELDDDPPGSWLYIYQYPNGCLTALSVLQDGATDDAATEDFAVETQDDGNQVIYTNVEDAQLRYVALVEDAGKFPALVVNAIARLLASMLAGPVIKGTEGMRVAGAQYQLYAGRDGNGGELALAKQADSNARQSSKLKDFQPTSIAARL
jgi:hypothetical protein